MKRFKKCNCEDIPEMGIHKIGAALIKDGKVVAVRDKDEEEFMILGGRHEENETFEEGLAREVKEELGLTLIKAEFMGRFEDIALHSDIPLFVDMYQVKCEGNPTLLEEIEELIWIPKDYDKNLKLGTILEHFVIPALIDKNILQ